ncbi:hypothetical protein [[Clostridium] symbiosum]|uniref:hypothetical protein n=1 Tax=Clostridium symbiosum TaxID=1512 RepID=UPI0025A409EF|nr:hypothetical protein [[Clostridium] symbiosum]MDM8134324.1 hypothetical protein [[Clostridium] symbiosum]MDM8138475.1 hypothetical protein [[Clostridium] symbiosum]MDM8317938.1 hypothetical protein [[Clostridium] symbiosum]
MDNKALSTAILSKFLEYGWLDSFQDFYHLDMYREEIILLKGFGVKSYESLWSSIEASRHTILSTIWQLWISSSLAGP